MEPAGGRLCDVLPYKEVQDYCPRVTERGTFTCSLISHADMWHVSPSVHGFIWWNDNIKETQTKRWWEEVDGAGDGGLGAADEMQNKDEMEIQSDTMQERREGGRAEEWAREREDK